MYTQSRNVIKIHFLAKPKEGKGGRGNAENVKVRKREREGREGRGGRGQDSLSASPSRNPGSTSTSLENPHK